MTGKVENRISITMEMREQIEKQMQRARLSAPRLDALINKRLSTPSGVNYAQIILKRKAKFIDALIWEEIIAILSSLPDAPKTTGSELGWSRDGCIPLTETMRKEFDNEIEWTGAIMAKIYRRFPNSLRKVYQNLFATWKSGTAKTVDAELWDQVISILKAMPDKKPIVPKSESRSRTTHKASAPKVELNRPIMLHENLEPVSDEEIEAIKFHRARTGIPYREIIAGCSSAPQGLHYYTISAWVRKTTRKANKEHVEWVIQRLVSLPDKPR